MRRLDTHAFGCACSVLVARPEADLGWIEPWLVHAEGVLSRFEPESELRRLNARPGVWVAVSALLWDVLTCALRVARGTEQRLTPTVLPALLRAGYDTAFTPGDAERPGHDGPPRPAPDVAAIALDPAARRVRLEPGVALDLGGFAKGFLAERLADALPGAALVDLGGDLAVRGPRPDGTDFIVETEPAPRGPARRVALRSGGIATSGRDYRRWRRRGVPVHHLIDPRTGEPAVTDLLRATVIAPTAVLAEAAAKLAVLLGARAARTFIEARPELAALLVDDAGEEWVSSRFALLLEGAHDRAS